MTPAIGTPIRFTAECPCCKKRYFTDERVWIEYDGEMICIYCAGEFFQAPLGLR